MTSDKTFCVILLISFCLFVYSVLLLFYGQGKIKTKGNYKLDKYTQIKIPALLIK